MKAILISLLAISFSFISLAQDKELDSLLSFALDTNGHEYLRRKIIYKFNEKENAVHSFSYLSRDRAGTHFLHDYEAVEKFNGAGNVETRVTFDNMLSRKDSTVYEYNQDGIWIKSQHFSTDKQEDPATSPLLLQKTEAHLDLDKTNRMTKKLVENHKYEKNKETLYSYKYNDQDLLIEKIECDQTAAGCIPRVKLFQSYDEEGRIIGLTVERHNVYGALRSIEKYSYTYSQNIRISTEAFYDFGTGDLVDYLVNVIEFLEGGERKKSQTIYVLEWAELKMKSKRVYYY